MCVLRFWLALASNPGVFAFDRGDLHLVAVRIEDIDALGTSLRIGAGGLQRVVDARVVPIGDRIGDVIDNGLRLALIVAEIARDEELAAFALLRAESEIGASH